MARDLFTFTIRYYKEPMYGVRHLGPKRYALDLGRVSLILEVWVLRR